MALGDFISKYSHTGRKLARKERSRAKAAAKAQLADVESEIAFRETEDPREQSALKQSMFGRGLGKSTIATQGATRLGDIQARRKAALYRQKDLAYRGLSLIKLRAKAARRNLPFDVLDLAESGVGMALGAGWKPLGGAEAGGTDMGSAVFELD